MQTIKSFLRPLILVVLIGSAFSSNVNGQILQQDLIFSLVSGISSCSSNPDVSISPDPATTVVNVSISNLPSGEEAYVSLYDDTASSLAVNLTSSGQTSFNVSALAPDDYLIIILSPSVECYHVIEVQ